MTTSPAPPRLLAPVRLPLRLDGTRLDHLSASSLALFWRCSESWRARYLARVHGPESGELRRGWVVDAAIEAHFKALLATGEPLPQCDVEDIFAAAWQTKIDDAAVEIEWGEDSPAHVKDSGLIALRAYLAELAPTVRPTSVQREFAFALAPDLEGSLSGCHRCRRRWLGRCRPGRYLRCARDVGCVAGELPSSARR